MQTFQVAIVAGIRACIGGVVIHLQKAHCQIHLTGAGLAASHVQFKTHRLKTLVFLLQLCLLLCKLLAGHRHIICHLKTHSFIALPISHSTSLRICYAFKCPARNT